MMDRRLEAADVLYGLRIDITRTGFQVLVERRKDLRVQHLKATDPVTKAFHWDSLYHLVLMVDTLNTHYVITKVEGFESTI